MLQKGKKKKDQKAHQVCLQLHTGNAKCAQLKQISFRISIIWLLDFEHFHLNLIVAHTINGSWLLQLFTSSNLNFGQFCLFELLIDSDKLLYFFLKFSSAIKCTPQSSHLCIYLLLSCYFLAWEIVICKIIVFANDISSVDDVMLLEQMSRTYIV